MCPYCSSDTDGYSWGCVVGSTTIFLLRLTIANVSLLLYIDASKVPGCKIMCCSRWLASNVGVYADSSVLEKPGENYNYNCNDTGNDDDTDEAVDVGDEGEPVEDGGGRWGGEKQRAGSWPEEKKVLILDWLHEDEDKVDVNDGEVDQPSRVGSPSAVGGVHLQGARLPSDEPVQLVEAGVLTIQFRGFVPFVKV